MLFEYSRNARSDQIATAAVLCVTSPARPVKCFFTSFHSELSRPKSPAECQRVQAGRATDVGSDLLNSDSLLEAHIGPIAQSQCVCLFKKRRQRRAVN